jgi:hypothetical protein
VVASGLMATFELCVGVPFYIKKNKPLDHTR